MNFPKEVQEFLETHDLTLTIEDFIVYTVDQDIIDNACVTDNDGVFLQWETSGEDVFIFGSFIDSL